MSFVNGKNYYEILGVPRDASVEEIKVAYKEIARVYHPDSNFYADLVDQSLSNSQLEIFQQITAAYSTLASKNKRVEYDKTLPPDLKGWAEEVDDDQELLEALAKIGVDPESVGVTAKPKRRRKNSEAYGTFGTAIQAGSSEASLGSIQAQFGVSGFRHGEETFPKPKRPTLTNIIRPQPFVEERPADNGFKFKEANTVEQPDTKIKLLLMVFVGTGSLCFGMSVVAFLMLR